MWQVLFLLFKTRFKLLIELWWSVSISKSLIILRSRLAGTVKYTDCISAEDKNYPPNECPWYDAKLHLMVRLKPWNLGNVEYPFIAKTPSSTLIRSGSTWWDPIYGSNRTVWHLNCMQTNDLCKIELFEIELFHDLTVCKQMTDV